MQPGGLEQPLEGHLCRPFLTPKFVKGLIVQLLPLCWQVWWRAPHADCGLHSTQALCHGSGEGGDSRVSEGIRADRYRKITAETPSMLAESYINLWMDLLRCLISLFEMPEGDSIPDDEHFIDVEDTPGYQKAFAQLALWAAKNRIPLAQMSRIPRHTWPNPCTSYPRSILANSVPSLRQDWMLNRSSSCKTICKLQTFQPFFNYIHLLCVYPSVQLLKLHKSQANLCYAFSVFC